MTDCIGKIAKFGKGADAFELYVEKVDKRQMAIGFHMDGHHGVFEAPVADITSVRKGAKPVAATIIVEVTEPVAPKTKRTPPTRASTGPSKFDQAVEIAKANPTADRKALIELLVTELKMTPAGASTYASTARKAARA